MPLRPLSLTAIVALALAGSFVLPVPADAGSRRRNYAEEWRREEIAEERREERERARQQRLQHEEEQAKRWQEHQLQAQGQVLDHNERQLDAVLDHVEGVERTRTAPPAAPAKPTGTCIYGGKNQVIYQPAGVVCAKR